MDCNVIKVTQKISDLIQLNRKYIGCYIILKKGSYINKILPKDEIERVQINDFDTSKLVQSFVMLKRDKVFEVQLYKQPMEYTICKG